jgi:ABC-type molybdate transport system substrate-binding protein
VLVPGDGGVDERAAAFLDFLDSDEARALLVDAGFLPASSGRSP